MKPLFIIASLLLNGLLVAVIASRPTIAPAGVQEFLARHFSETSTTALRPATKPAPVQNRRQPSWTSLHSEDPRTYVARLRAAGFPASIIRTLVTAEVSARYDERIRALQDPDPDLPFWKIRPPYFGFGDKRLEEMNLLQRERAKVLRELFNDEFFASDDVTSGQRRQYGNLSRSKIDAVQRIEDDYTEMMSAVRSGAGGVMLPEDREKLALLNREKRADLAAVLSAEELADYELRSSPATNMLRSRLGTFDPTEAEFRAIVQAQQGLSEKLAGSFSTLSPEVRETAQNAYQEQLRMALGEARYADFQRETNNEFQQLMRMAQQKNLPRETAVRAFDLRDTAARESDRIFDDATMSVDQKRTALLSLAQLTRSQLLATLGPGVGPEYLKVSETWLSQLERGAAVSFARQGTMFIVSDQGNISFSGGPTYRRLPGAPLPGR